MKLNIFTFCLVSSVLTACSSVDMPSVQAEYTLESTGKIMPLADVVEHYERQADWWKVYQNTALNQVVQTAMERNADLKQAAIQVNKALYQANLLGANLLPTWSGVANAGSTRNLDTQTSSRVFGGQLALSYELDLWRKLHAQTSASAWAYHATQQDLAATQLSIQNQTVNAFFRIAYLNQAIQLSEKVFKQNQGIERIAQAQYRYGKIAKAESEQASQNRLQASNQVLTLQAERENQLNVLANLLNVETESLRTESEAYELSPSAGVNLDVPTAVLGSRPDLRAAEYRLQSAWQNQLAQQRSWYPSISIGATLSASSSQSSSAFNVPFLGGTVRIQLPFLDWANLKWQNKTAEAEFQTAYSQFEQRLNTALNEVVYLYQAHQYASKQHSHHEQKLNLAKNNTRYYQQRYQQGKVALKDWLDALNSEASQMQTALNSRYQVLSNEIAVYQAMAGRYQAKSF